MMKVLVTGATGYVGGRLIPRLLEKGYLVRAMARDISKLKGRYWSSHPNIELVAADVLDYNSLYKAVEGCDAAFYLIHSMVREVANFESTDREAALNFVAAAEKSGLKRIIYLGGLGNEKDQLSKHLQSRKEVGAIFKISSVPVTILRAAMVIGSGSASFEILRYLVDRLPWMITPKWVRTPCQPISIVNVLYYLVHLLEEEKTMNQTYDIGGPDIIDYQTLMDIYAEEAGLKKRKVLKVGVLTPWLSSHWIGLVTPLPATLGKPLTEGLSNKVICEDLRIRELIPQHLLSCREAIKRAIDQTQHNQVETSWTDSGVIPPAEWVDKSDPKWAGGTIFEDRNTTVIEADPHEVWQTLLKVGGKTGWYSTGWLWKLRGWFDKIIGGVGLTRGRRDTSSLQVGDAIDFWRVSILNPDERLLLSAEMKVPGEAALDFVLKSLETKKTQLEITARFRPSGFWGLCYWYVVSPFHYLIFNSMLKKITADVIDSINRTQKH